MTCGPRLPSRELLWTCLLGAALALASAAQADPVFFDGPTIDGVSTGLDAATATALDPQPLQLNVTPADDLSVTYQSANGRRISSGTTLPSDYELDSDWVVRYTGEGDLPQNVYLLFEAALNTDVGTLGTTNYDVDLNDALDSTSIDHVGFVLPSGDSPWRVVSDELDLTGQPAAYFFLGYHLDFSQVNQSCGDQTLGDREACVSLRYFIQNPDNELFQDGTDYVLGLPQLKIGQAVVPEPATGGLLGLGLAALAGLRRRRS